MSKGSSIPMTAVVLSTMALNVHAWDHPSHMITAAIAFMEIERSKPELIEKIELLFMKHPDTSPFWVAAGDARGSRTRQTHVHRRCTLGRRYQRDDTRPSYLAHGTLGHRCERRPAGGKGCSRGPKRPAGRPGHRSPGNELCHAFECGDQSCRTRKCFELAASPGRRHTPAPACQRPILEGISRRKCCRHARVRHGPGQ